jgi:nicotinate-nucleotide adenylyltransferase
MMRFSDAQIDALRERVRGSMSDFRFVHTAEVERMAARIGKLYAPEKLDILRAAALLHDVTKEIDADGQIELLERAGERAGELERLSYKTLHARTAVYAVKRDYPEFADEELLLAVRYHTTGRADMSICEKIIFLADYIDESRKFEDCVRLRNYFWNAHPENMSESERERHLLQTILIGLDSTLVSLIEEGAPTDPDSVAARNFIIQQLKK